MNRNEFYTALSDYNDEHSLKHYGTKGQKWGVRKYQNKDGSLTPAGREHYGYGDGDDDRSGDYSGAKKSGGLKPMSKWEYYKAKRAAKKIKKEKDKQKEEYQNQLKKDPEHTHKYKSQDMNLAESMSDEDAAKLNSIEDKMVQVAKTSGTSSKEYKDLDAQYGKTEKSIVDKMNKADGTDRYKSINSSYDNASKTGKKSERKAAFDESTRVTGKEEAEAWKRLADYYEAQQKNKKG